VSKLAGEKYCSAFYTTFGLETISLRYFNVYGERQKDNPYSGVIAIFANTILRNRKAHIDGDGGQTRDFIHVTDVARANLAALECQSGKGEAFNIGTGIATSINTLFHLVASSLGQHSARPIHRPPRVGDIRDSCANVGKAERVLGFRPQIKLEDGLLRVTKWLASP
jgi:nucleoside-diphosphate-sugar epimerase